MRMLCSQALKLARVLCEQELDEAAVRKLVWGELRHYHPE